MGDTTPNHSSNSEYEIPTFYSIGALDSLGGCWDLEVLPECMMQDFVHQQLIRHLDVISGIAEWDQIRFRRRRAILNLAMRYFASSRLTTGTLVSQESLALHRFDLEQMEGETYIVSYTNRFIADPLRTSFLF